MGSQVRQGEQKTKEISECEKRIEKIKAMQGEIALALGVFQQPVKPRLANQTGWGGGATPSPLLS
jgi:hypothetical protein